MTDNEMFIWMTEQPEGQLCSVFGKWLEASKKNKYLGRALRDLGRKFSNDALLEKMEHQWVIAFINHELYRGYVTRDYSLEGWMLSFSNRSNYCFKAQDVVSVEWDGVNWTIEFNNDPNFIKEEQSK